MFKKAKNLCCPNMYNFVLPAGLGDTYFICAYKQALEEKYGAPIHFIIKPKHEVVLKMFGVSGYDCVDLTKKFFKTHRFSKIPEKGKLFIAHPSYNRKDIMDWWNATVLSLRDLYVKFLDIPENTPLAEPLKWRGKNTTNIDTKKAVFISLSARSIPSLEKSYWQDIANTYLDKGYTVINNTLDESDCLDGCVNVDLPLEDLVSVAIECEHVYTIRSGLSDILSFLGQKLTVVYPWAILLDLYGINNSFLLSPEKQVNEVVYKEDKLTKKPMISVVTPIYNLIKSNRKDAFVRMLESVKNQTYRNFEHIIIDGASNDGTLEFLESLKKEYTFKVFSEKDKGLYDAMNKGVQKATGEYVVFMNSDDYFTTHAFEKHALELSKGADFSFAKAIVVGEHERWLFVPVESEFFYTMPYSHQTMFVKRDILLKWPFDLQYKLAADFDFIQKVEASQYKGVYVDYVTAYYDAGGLSGQQTDKVFTEWEAILKHHWGTLLKLHKQKIIRSIVRKHTVPAKVRCRMTNWLLGKGLPILTRAKLWIRAYQVRILGFIKVEKFYVLNCIWEDMKISVFGIPIVTTFKNNKKFKLRLFKMIPILSGYKKGSTTRWKLFHFIPFCTIKRG